VEHCAHTLVRPLLGGMLLALSACDNVDQAIYNCERVAVSVDSTRTRIGPLSYFTTMGHGAAFDRQMYVYSDGSRHKPKVVPKDAERRTIKSAAGNEKRVEAMCRVYGPDVLVILHK
jgi:hypothetical protein